jgi:cell wall-associated NlpC family hydrolase
MEALPAWAAGYVGLPFLEHGRSRAGVDCWGLVRLVYAERLGVALPSYLAGHDGVGRADAEAIARLVRGGLAIDGWRAVPAGEERELDGILLRTFGHPMHMGVVLAPGRMLHVDRGIDAAIEDYRGERWRRRVVAFYRWGLADA